MTRDTLQKIFCICEKIEFLFGYFFLWVYTGVRIFFVKKLV